MELHEKLFIARTVLALTQQEAASAAGTKQVTVGKLERGEREGVPENYINFLYEKGIDLNWIFNSDENTRNIFREDRDSVTVDKSETGEGARVIPMPVDGNFFIMSELLETRKLTQISIKQVESVLTELLAEIKKMNMGGLQQT